MGTRSLTYVYDGKRADMGKPMVCMYRQFDGYPGGHGQELADFMNNGRLVNGLSGMGKELQFNGMGCFAAQMVAHFKKDSGGIYLYAPELNQDCWQEYEYHVWEDMVRIDNPDDIIFEGTWNQFKVFCFNLVETE